MLQPVFATDGFRDPSSKYTRLALRLCRYDRPPGAVASPTSFGWIDSGGRRFVFRRVFLTDDQTGHPGNFAAHVVSGPIADLPVSVVLQSYASQDWWEPERSEKGSISSPIPTKESLAAIAPMAGSADAETLLELILSGRRPIAMAWDPDRLIAAAIPIVSRLPRVLEDRSFSTYESGEPATWFDLIGSPKSNSNATPGRNAAVASAYILRNPPKRSLQSMLGEVTLDVARLTSFSLAVSSLAAISSRDASTQLSQLMPALNAPDAIVDVLRHPAAVRMVADALVVDDMQVARALASHAALLSWSLWAALGRRIASNYGSELPSSARCLALERVSPHLLEALAVHLIEDPIVVGWPPDLTRAGLRARARLDGPRVSLLLSFARTSANPEWLFDDKIDIASRSELLVQMCADHRIASAQPFPLDCLVYLLRSAEDSADSVLAQVPKEVAAQALISAFGSIAIGRWQPALRHLVILSRMLERFPDGLAVTVFAACADTFSDWPSERRALLDWVIQRTLVLVLREPEMSYPEELARLGSFTPQSSLGQVVSARPSEMSHALQRAIESSQGKERAFLASVAVDMTLCFGASSAVEAGSLDSHITMAANTESARITAILIAGYRAYAVYGRAAAGEWALRRATWMALSNPSSISAIIDGPRAPAWEEVVLVAAALFGLIARDKKQHGRLVDVIGNFGRPGRAWYKLLEK